jgi:hypothetical protein
MTNNLPRHSPYVGLVPFTESDKDFFCGRTSEIEIISANLRAAPLTLVYGPSGVGKSSLLQAGVLSALTEQSRQNMRVKGTPEFATAIFKDWSDNILNGLNSSIHAAILKAQKIRALEPVPAPSLAEMLHNTFERFGLKLLIILDQFEEYFQYLEKGGGDHDFARQFTEVCKQCDLPVHFLISMRDDTLHKLDYFKGKVPNLFDNRLMLKKLDIKAARDAVTGPLSAYNKLLPEGQEPFKIEPALVEEVLKQIQNVKGTESEFLSENPEDSSVETTYLQLVMTRIWNEEMRNNSKELRLSTFTNLGGAKKIVNTHLDSVMESFSTRERNIAADCFKYLANPMGLKMAYPVSMLAEYTKWPEAEITPVLETLVQLGEKQNGRKRKSKEAKPEAGLMDETRVLRPVEFRVGQKRHPGYEVAHDALIEPMSEWRSQWRAHSINLIWKRRVQYVIGAVILVGLLASFFVYRYQIDLNLEVNKKKDNELQNANIQAKEEKEKALDDVIENEQENTQALIKVLVDLRSGNKNEKADAAKRLHELLVQEKIPESMHPIIISLVQEIDAAEAETLKKVIAQKDDPNSVKNLTAPIYLHIQDERQRHKAEDLKKTLETIKFVDGVKLAVPDIENVGSRKLASTILKYFDEDEKDRSEVIVEFLQVYGIKNITVKYVDGYDDSPEAKLRHFELWFAADAFASK